MSKLSEKIRLAGQVRQSPIGFGAMHAAAKSPSMLLIGYLPVTAGKQIAKTAGCDAFLLQAGLPPTDDHLKEAVTAAKDALCGLSIASPDADMVERARKAGFDFIAFEAERTPASALLDRKLGLVLSLKDDLSDMELRVLEALGLDAVLLKAVQLPMTVRAQIELHRVASLVRAPLIAPVAQAASTDELRTLRDAGVAAALVDLSVSASPDALRQAIDALPPRQAQRANRVEATIPATATAGEPEEEEED